MIHAASENTKDDLQYDEMSEVRAQPCACTRHGVSLARVCRRFHRCDASLFCVTQGEKIIFEYFSDPEFVEQLVEFLSLEERKGKDSFNPRRFCLFKVFSLRWPVIDAF